MRSSRSPASVGATLRVVRASRRRPEPRLQAAQRVAQRGLRDAELGGRPGETAFPRDGDKGDDVIEIVPGHS